MRLDPLDGGDPRQARWEEFRASFAAPRLQLWILDELGAEGAEYLKDLGLRWYSGFLNAEGLASDDPEYDGAVPVQGPADRGVTFMDADVAAEMYSQLFPHGHDDADFFQASLGLITIGLHSALEAYAQGLGVVIKGTALPQAVRKWLRDARHGAGLDADVAEWLAECDLTRHLFVHNRGIVDKRYIARARECKFLEGERRVLDVSVVEHFASAVWRTAKVMHSVE